MCLKLLKTILNALDNVDINFIFGSWLCCRRLEWYAASFFRSKL